ncbi:MAG: hypothetical protein M2R45_05474 [Verrucomicrobia subdivision 3 bacterium]|nr:hypothetical protein [Limisphaerales bacterium]MCS1417574.1 hypothetical protein [Limisphaerales bacterium]
MGKFSAFVRLWIGVNSHKPGRQHGGHRRGTFQWVLGAGDVLKATFQRGLKRGRFEG